MKLALRKGFDGVKEAQHQSEVRREMAKDRIMSFFPPKQGDAKIRFLTEEPLIYPVHPTQEPPYTSFCDGTESCARCRDGERVKDEYAWLVWDYSTFEIKVRDSGGKETGEKKKVTGSVKKVTRGLTDAMKIMKNYDRYGLSNRDYIVEKGVTKTSGWDWDRQDEEMLSKDQINKIRATLPERLRNLDFYEILEKQIVPPTLGEISEAPSREDVRSEVSRGVHDEEEEENGGEEEQKTTHKKLSFNRKH